MHERLREFQVAVMLLTRLPAGRLDGDAPDLTAARWAFPLVGLVIGTLTWSIFTTGLALDAQPLIASILALFGLTLITGALHLDGLADFADGIGGGRDKAHCLEIMRDSRIGSYGVVALILALGLWSASLAQLSASAGFFSFIAIASISRASMVLLLELLPSAREDGMGVRAAGRSAPAMVSIAGFALMTLFLGWAGLLILATVACVTIIVGRLAKRRIGGQTGDVLGAAQMLSETACWTVLAIATG